MRPFLRTANILWGKIDVSVLDYMHFEETEEQKLTLQYGDLLVCEGGDIGRTAIWRDQIKPCYYQNHLHRLRSTLPDIIPIFYMYWMELAFTISRLYGGVGNKTTIPNLSQSRLSSFYIPLPPLSEQKAIAAVLSAIQEAKEKTEAVITATKELKKSMMKHLFTYGPVSPKEKDKVELKQTELGPLPKEWEVVNFEYCITKNNFSVGKVKQQEYRKNGKYPIIDQGQNLIAGFWENEEDVYNGNLPVIIFGDHTRIIKFIDFPFVLGADGAKVLIPNIEIIYHRFFYYALLILNIPSRGYNRHYSLLKESKIPLPPLPIQQKIASILSAIDAKIEAEVNKKKALEALFKSMLHHLMTGKVRVKDLRLGD